jgi:hypothetical protein
MNDSEVLDTREAAAALDPSVGDGTPDTAPHIVPFDRDDDLRVDDASGGAEDDDLVEDDDDTPIDQDV